MRTAAPVLRITKPEARRLVKLLGELQNHLESAIDGSLVEGEQQPREKALRPLIARDRRLWREAEALVKKLSKARA